MFERSDLVFEDEDVLSDDYRPDDLSERMAEIEEYRALLQPIIEGATPDNVFLYGKTGVGKTVVTRYLFEHLKRDARQYDDLEVTTVYINCENAATSYQAVIALVNELRDSLNEPQISSTGYPKHQVYQFLWEAIDTLGGTVVTVLDEVDYLGTDASILYQLPRAKANGNVERAKVGVVGISNDFRYKDQLNPRILDTLAEKELHFPPYDATQLRSILEERASEAFKPGAVNRGAIQLCAAKAAKDKGSARQALDLLLYAGQRARQREHETVTDDHVMAAHNRLQREEIKRGMRDLTKHGKLALGSLVTVRVNNPDEEITRKGIYEKYVQLAEGCNESPLKIKSLHRHLGDLAMQGIATRKEENLGEAGGRRYTYEVSIPIGEAIDALDDSTLFQDELDFGKLREPAQVHGLLD